MGHRSRHALSLGALVATAILVGSTPQANADSPKKTAVPPNAEVMIIHATKCSEKKVDPAIHDTPPLGYDCMALLKTVTMPLPLQQPSTAVLPNGRTFHLFHTAWNDNKFKVTASISPADGGPGYVKLADISAEPNKPFNVGGFSHQGGVLVLTVRIVPPPDAGP